jgi:hypothetical protein
MSFSFKPTNFDEVLYPFPNTSKLTEAECNLLKAKRKSLMDLLISLTEKEQALIKKSKSLTNEVLAEKISVEKLRIEG